MALGQLLRRGLLGLAPGGGGLGPLARLLGLLRALGLGVRARAMGLGLVGSWLVPGVRGRRVMGRGVGRSGSKPPDAAIADSVVVTRRSVDSVAAWPASVRNAAARARRAASASRCAAVAESSPSRSFAAVASSLSNASRACHHSWFTVHAEIGGRFTLPRRVAPALSPAALSSPASRLRSVTNAPCGAWNSSTSASS
jgi:hypothetical protein